MSNIDIEKVMITLEEMASLRSWAFEDQDQEKEKEWKEMVEASKRQIELCPYASDRTIMYAHNKIVNLERLLAAKDAQIAELEQTIRDMSEE